MRRCGTWSSPESPQWESARAPAHQASLLSFQASTPEESCLVQSDHEKDDESHRVGGQDRPFLVPHGPPTPCKRVARSTSVAAKVLPTLGPPTVRSSERSSQGRYLLYRFYGRATGHGSNFCSGKIRSRLRGSNSIQTRRATTTRLSPPPLPSLLLTPGWDDPVPSRSTNPIASFLSPLSLLPLPRPFAPSLLLSPSIPFARSPR